MNCVFSGEALGAIGDAAALPVLEKYSKDSDNVVGHLLHSSCKQGYNKTKQSNNFVLDFRDVPTCNSAFTVVEKS